jgi:hypothetical protein
MATSEIEEREATRDPAGRLTVNEVKRHMYWHGVDWELLNRRTIPSPLLDVDLVGESVAKKGGQSGEWLDDLGAFFKKQVRDATRRLHLQEARAPSAWETCALL